MSSIDSKLLQSVVLTNAINQKYKDLLAIDDTIVAALTSTHIFKLQEQRYKLLLSIIEEALL